MRSISSKDVKFIIQPETKKIVCVIENCKNDFIDFITQETPFASMLKPQDFKVNKYQMPDTFYGIATCQDDDEWNESIGRKVALNKAKAKWGASFFKRANSYMTRVNETFEMICDKIDNFGANLAENLSHRQKKIEEHFNQIEGQ